jgi:hypothetical protein
LHTTVGLCDVLIFCVNFSSEPQPNKVTVVEVMQKDDSKGQARTAADSEQKDEDLFVCQHRSKPSVVRSPFLCLVYVV